MPYHSDGHDHGALQSKFRKNLNIVSADSLLADKFEGSDVNGLFQVTPKTDLSQ
jgi:hypothetical protein